MQTEFTTEEGKGASKKITYEFELLYMLGTEWTLQGIIDNKVRQELI